jgi:soluble lytic murein transglycosylase-like protein
MATASATAASVAEPASRVSTVVRADRKTGRLVRSVIVPRKAIPPKAKSGPVEPASSSGVHLLVEQAARNYDVDPLLVHSVIKVESNYNPFAISHKGAEGLMQLIPSTARRFGVTNPFDPKENIDGGVRYLKYLMTIFGDDRLVLAAYNAGEGAVARYGWIPPYRETQDYVRKVSQRYGDAKRAAEQKKPPEPPAVAVAEPEYPVLERYEDELGRVYFRTR